MKKISKKTNSIKKPQNAVLLFAVVYLLMVIISVIDRIDTLKELSTTNVSFTMVLSEFWFPIVVIVLLIATLIAYRKKEMYGIMLEFSIAICMIANMMVNSILVGFRFGMIILPLILLPHAIYVFIQERKNKSA